MTKGKLGEAYKAHNEKMAKERLEKVYEVLDKIVIPMGEGDMLIPKTKKDGDTIRYLDQGESLLLGQEISREVFGRTNERYALLRIQRIYESTYYELKRAMDGGDYVIARESIIDLNPDERDFDDGYTKGVVILDPRVEVTDDGEIEYKIDGVSINESGRIDGGIKNALIYRTDTAKTLNSAGAFEGSERPFVGSALVSEIEERTLHSVFGTMIDPTDFQLEKQKQLEPETKVFYIMATPYSYPHDCSPFFSVPIPTVAVFEKVLNKK